MDLPTASFKRDAGILTTVSSIAELRAAAERGAGTVAIDLASVTPSVLEDLSARYRSAGVAVVLVGLPNQVEMSPVTAANFNLVTASA